jgi:hypothetical protein
MKTLLILVGLLSLASSSFAQAPGNLIAGYLVTSERDTLRGFILDRNDKWSVDAISFYTSESAEARIYPVAQIAMMYLQPYDAYYYVRLVDYDTKSIEISSLETNARRKLVTENVLLQLLSRGRINLFDYTDEGGKRHFFVQKDDGKTEELAYIRYLANVGQIAEMRFFTGTLQTLTSDCDKVKLVVPTELKDKLLTKFITKYNECMGSVSYSKEKEKSQATISVLGGLSFGNAMFTGRARNSLGTDNANQKYSITTVVNFGVDVEFVPGRKTNRWRPGFELGYMKSGKTSTGIPVANYELQFESINIGPTFRYNLTQERLVALSLRASIGGSYLMNGDGIRTSSISTPLVFVNFRKFGYNAFVSLGMQIKIISLELRGSILHEPSEIAAAARFSSLGVILGVRLK